VWGGRHLDRAAGTIPDYGVNRALHNLLFAANSSHADPKVRGLARPLKGNYVPGKKVTAGELAPKILEIANICGKVRKKEPRDPTDCAIFESAADWGYDQAETSLVGLTGVEGVIALLKAKDVWDIDKTELEICAFTPRGSDNMFRDMHWESCFKKPSPLECNALYKSLQDKSLKPYWGSLSVGLAKGEDPRAIALIEKLLENEEIFPRDDLEAYLIKLTSDCTTKAMAAFKRTLDKYNMSPGGDLKTEGPPVARFYYQHQEKFDNFFAEFSKYGLMNPSQWVHEGPGVMKAFLPHLHTLVEVAKVFHEAGVKFSIGEDDPEEKWLKFGLDKVGSDFSEVMMMVKKMETLKGEDRKEYVLDLTDYMKKWHYLPNPYLGVNYGHPYYHEGRGLIFKND